MYHPQPGAHGVSSQSIGRRVAQLSMASAWPQARGWNAKDRGGAAPSELRKSFAQLVKVLDNLATELKKRWEDQAVADPAQDR
ncbi:hypothetical protein E4U52_002705 [Claviceps spartinae]|nr:hypothetical protein E4U52_002705 [Claviceps spartinae]